MYIWNTNKLVQALKSGNVTERDFKNYYLASSIIMLVSYYLATAIPVENTTMVLIEAIGSIGITIFGIDFVFRCNGGDSGSHFLNKALSLSLPLMAKAIVAGFCVGIALAILEETSLAKQAVEIIYTGLVLLIQLVFFWRLAVHVQRVNA